MQVRPGLILFVQTFGDLVTFNPHIHVLAADGLFRADGARVRAGDAQGRKQFAQYMLRAPFSLEKMTYLPDTAMLMYRSHMHKSLKRNFQLMPGAQWLEMLCRHVPDRFEHLVRYVGWYSSRCRGEQARKAVPVSSAASTRRRRDGCRARQVGVGAAHSQSL